MTVVAVIPARYDSSRFPGKALVALDGVPMVVRTARRAANAARVDRVVVATDHPAIERVAREAGFVAVRTDHTLRSGTDRVHAALSNLALRSVSAGVGTEPSLVVNVQGDEPLIDPRDLDALIDAATGWPDSISTLGRPYPVDVALSDTHHVKAVVKPDGTVVTFTRGSPDGPRPLLHVGVYAYRPDILSRFCNLKPSPNEQAERLEQLRALDNGISIRLTMCVSERPTISVDVPEDVPRVLAALREEGERGP